MRRTATPTLARGVAGALYVLNPAALYDVAHWAQPDGAHSLFSVLAIGLLGLGQVIAPWAAMAAAALAKPQAWSILPLLAIATLRWHGLRRPGARARGRRASPSLVIVLPFIVTGRLGELLSLPGHGRRRSCRSCPPTPTTCGGWSSSRAARTRCSSRTAARALGPLTYRTVAAALVGAVLLLTYWLYWTRRASLAEAAALGVLGWFTFTTQAHENHLFFALPLLSLAWPTRRSLLVPFGIISLTLLLNMVLHDQLVLEALGLERAATRWSNGCDWPTRRPTCCAASAGRRWLRCALPSRRPLRLQ